MGAAVSAAVKNQLDAKVDTNVHVSDLVKLTNNIDISNEITTSLSNNISLSLRNEMSSAIDTRIQANMAINSNLKIGDGPITIVSVAVCVVFLAILWSPHHAAISMATWVFMFISLGANVAIRLVLFMLKQQVNALLLEKEQNGTSSRLQITNMSEQMKDYRHELKEKVNQSDLTFKLSQMVDNSEIHTKTYTKREIDDKLSQKVGKSETHTKREIDDKLSQKVDKSETHTKTVIDDKLSRTKTEIDDKLSRKVDQSKVVPVYRSYKNQEKNHLYSREYSEGGQNGYVNEGIEFYALSGQGMRSK